MNLDIQNQQLKNDILQRIHDMKCLCIQAKSTGIQTLITLADQDEQFNDITLYLSSIDSKLNDTKQDLNRMKRLRQRLLDFICSPFNHLSKQKILSKFTCNSNSSLSLKRSYSIPKISQHKTTIINPMNFEIDELQTMIYYLKDLALDINDHLTRQNLTINDINQHVDRLNNSIEKQNIIIQKIV